MKKVCVVVVTYNRKELLKENIEALLSSDYSNFRILIIDNCSTDGTYDDIKGYLDEKTVFYFKTEKNIGGAGGFNYGMKKAVETNDDYIWLMDDDCIVKNDTLSALVKFAEEKEDNFGFLSSVVLWKDESVCKMNVQKISLKKKVEDFSKVERLTFASFVSFFVRRAAVVDVGLPISDFFIWGDDFEYSSRIATKYPSYLVPNSVVIHKSARNIGSNIVQDEIENLWRYEYAYRNEYYLFHQLGFKAKLYFFIKTRVHILKVFISRKDQKKLRIKTIKKAIKEGKRFHPSIEYVGGKNDE